MNLSEKHGENSFNPLIRIYTNIIENGIMYKIKTGFYLKLWTSGSMKLLESARIKINKDNNGENLPHLKITEVVLMHWNIVNNDYQQELRVLFVFSLNKPFGQFLDISPKNFIFLKTFNSELSYIRVWFTDQNSKPLEIEDKINIPLANN